MRHTRTVVTTLLLLATMASGSRAAFAAGCPQYPMPFTSSSDPRVFDCRWYRQVYSDIAGMTCAAAESHWVNYGIGEGRVGSSQFFPVEYRSIHSDLQNLSNGGAIVHYLTYGMCEGRKGHAPRSTGIYSNDAIKAMDVPSPAYAYAFHATATGNPSSPYLAIFDAEVYNAPMRSVGDSTGARYGSAYDFGTHSFQQDLAITRSSTSSATGTSPSGSVTGWSGSSPYMDGGTSNPQLINLGGNWATYWLSVKQDGVGNYHHYPMLSWFGTDSSVTNYFGATMRTYQTNDTFDVTAGLFNKPVTGAGPVRDEGGGFVANEMLTTNPNATQGMIGSMTLGDDDSTTYFYYTDVTTSGHMVLRRRIVRPYLTYMSTPTQLADFGVATSGVAPYLLVNYHRDLDQYVALYFCNGTSYDICMRRFTNADLTTPADGGPAIGGIHFDTTDTAAYGISLSADPNIPRWLDGCGPGSTNFALGQFGIRKDANGRHITDADGQVIVYLQVGAPTNPLCNSYDPIWGNIYAKRLYINFDPY